MKMSRNVTFLLMVIAFSMPALGLPNGYYFIHCPGPGEPPQLIDVLGNNLGRIHGLTCGIRITLRGCVTNNELYLCGIRARDPDGLDIGANHTNYMVRQNALVELEFSADWSPKGGAATEPRPEAGLSSAVSKINFYTALSMAELLLEEPELTVRDEKTTVSYRPSVDGRRQVWLTLHDVQPMISFQLGIIDKEPTRERALALLQDYKRSPFRWLARNLPGEGCKLPRPLRNELETIVPHLRRGKLKWFW